MNSSALKMGTEHDSSHLTYVDVLTPASKTNSFTVSEMRTLHNLASYFTDCAGISLSRVHFLSQLLAANFSIRVLGAAVNPGLSATLYSELKDLQSSALNIELHPPHKPRPLSPLLNHISSHSHVPTSWIFPYCF